ncbi:IRK-interacting protein isoform X2 [Oryza sativa Japonica Group]|uniref:IRK-interacting protein isoform X2 n=1 Tax=Oryza sativa subsp. japonica TaxID=39947 RepID=UPI0007754390|nr:IRK-interacting protein isoform X2 [Oryza sativa Japonica Group]KAF2916796.1 hypothetical protein DAI22_09g146500 [Oryza sativa Japonica Group]
MAMAAAAAEAFGTAAATSTPPVQATRQDVQAAIAKAVELRALHAALLQRGGGGVGGGASASRSPAIIRLPPAASPALSRAGAAAAAVATVDEDYPVFTPAYDEEQMAGLSHICQDNRSRSENWSGIALGGGGSGDDDDDAAFSDYDNLNAFSSSNSELRFPSSTDHHRRHKVHPAFLHSAPSADRFLASAGRATMAGTAELLKAPSTCGSAFRPATIGRDHGIDVGALKFLASSGAPLSAAAAAAQPRPAKHRRAQILSWLFPRAKKKAKPMSPSAIERENMSQLLKEWGLLSLDSLRRELADANAHRDAALQEAAEMRSSLGELTTKLAGLEAYCSELKKALRLATSSTSNAQPSSSSMSRRSTRSIGASQELPGPVSHEAMVEGFLQIASEARLSVKQFCKALIQQVEEPDNAGAVPSGSSDEPGNVPGLRELHVPEERLATVPRSQARIPGELRLLRRTAQPELERGAQEGHQVLQRGLQPVLRPEDELHCVHPEELVPAMAGAAAAVLLRRCQVRLAAPPPGLLLHPRADDHAGRREPRIRSDVHGGHPT